MATLQFLKKLCSVGRTLLEQCEGHNVTLAERRRAWAQSRSYRTSEEQLYADHLQQCPVCRKALAQED